VSADYLDLLLTRETRAAPLAEPRIPAGAAALAAEPIWDAVIEERVIPYRPAVAASPADANADSSRPQIDRSAHESASVFPTRLGEHIEESPVPARPPTNEAAPLPFVQEANSERPPDRAIEVEGTRHEPTTPPPKIAEAAPIVVPIERSSPPSKEQQPRDPLEIPTRRVDSAPRLPPPQPAPQPVTIRIERIEVRAASPSAPPAPAKPRPGPRLGLDQYLKRRSDGGQ
jgi:hypothetical protein